MGDHEDQETLVRRATEQWRLLPDESPDSTAPVDIEHWISVYSELLAFKSRILDEMHARLAGMSPPAASEVIEIDVALVQRQRQRYQGRLAFWQHRARVAAGGSPSGSREH